MNAVEVRNQIRQKEIDNFYIFSGPEWAIQKIYINQLAGVINSDVIYADSLKDIYGKLVNKSFLSRARCYVVIDDNDLMVNEKVQSKIESVLNGDILIHIVTNLDKRSKYYKKYKDKIIVFDHLKPDILCKYVKRMLPELSDTNCNILMEICEYDYGRCLLEIDKIKLFSNWNTAPNVTVNDCFKVLLEEGTIYEPPYDAIFDFVDAVLKRQNRRAFDLLNQSYDSGEQIMVLLTVLYNSVKQLLQVQSYDGNNLADATGLTGWQIKKAKERIGYYTDDHLKFMLKLIRRCERGIKLGTIDEKYVMEYLLVNLL